MLNALCKSKLFSLMLTICWRATNKLLHLVSPGRLNMCPNTSYITSALFGPPAAFHKTLHFFIIATYVCDRGMSCSVKSFFASVVVQRLKVCEKHRKWAGRKQICSGSSNFHDSPSSTSGSEEGSVGWVGHNFMFNFYKKKYIYNGGGKSDVKCYQCKQPGHYKNQCTNSINIHSNKKNAQSKQSNVFSTVRKLHLSCDGVTYTTWLTIFTTSSTNEVPFMTYLGLQLHGGPAFDAGSNSQ